MSANAILRSSYEASCYIFVYAIDRVATLSHLLIGIDRMHICFLYFFL